MTRDERDRGANGSVPDDLSCRDLVELVTEYLEGSLPRAERARVDAHLSGCPGCTTYIEQMGETIRLTGRLRAVDLPPAAREALLQAFRDWKRV